MGVRSPALASPAPPPPPPAPERGLATSLRWGGARVAPRWWRPSGSFFCKFLLCKAAVNDRSDAAIRAAAFGGRPGWASLREPCGAHTPRARGEPGAAGLLRCGARGPREVAVKDTPTLPRRGGTGDGARTPTCPLRGGGRGRLSASSPPSLRRALPSGGWKGDRARTGPGRFVLRPPCFARVPPIELCPYLLGGPAPSA